MLIKMYKFTIAGYVPVYVHCIYSQSIPCRRSLSLFSLWFCLTQQFYQKACVWVICSDETSNQAKAKNLSNFTFLIVYLFVRFLHVRSISIYCQGLIFLVYIIWFAERKNKRKKKKKEPFFSKRENTLNRKSKPSTSTSSALPANRIYFFSTQNIHTLQET